MFGHNFEGKESLLINREIIRFWKTRINTSILISVLINLLAVTRRAPLISRARLSPVSKSCTVGSYTIAVVVVVVVDFVITTVVIAVVGNSPICKLGTGKTWNVHL